MIHFFPLSQSRKAAKKDRKKALRLCGFAKEMSFLKEEQRDQRFLAASVYLQPATCNLQPVF
jgi:hypothetical protein